MEFRTKRKRSPVRTTTAAAPRRSRHGVQQSPSALALLKPVNDLYHIYSLFDAVLPEDGPYDDDWYRAVLNVATTDHTQTRRLAARLLLRMAPKFCDFGSETLTALISLGRYKYRHRSRREDSLCRSTRQDAFSALAVSITSQPLRPRDATRLTEHLLRELDDLNRTLHEGRQMPRESPDRQTCDPELRTIFRLLESGFRKYPKEFLSVCFDMWESEGPFQAAAGTFFEEVLLRRPEGSETLCLAQTVMKSDEDKIHWTLKHIGEILERRRRYEYDSGGRHLAALRQALTRILPRRDETRSTGKSGRREQSSHQKSMSEDLSRPRQRESHLGGSSSRHSASTRSRGSERGHRGVHASGSSHERSGNKMESTEGAGERTVPRTRSPVLLLEAMSESVDRESLYCWCNPFGQVQEIVMNPKSKGSALVVFKTTEDAARCQDGLSRISELSGSKISRLNAASSESLDREKPQSRFVWISGPPSLEYETEIMNSLRSSHVEVPVQIIRVEGNSHGFVLEVKSLDLVMPTLSALGSVCSSPVHSHPKKKSRIYKSKSCPEDRKKSGEASQDGNSDSCCTKTSERTDPVPAGEKRPVDHKPEGRRSKTELFFKKAPVCTVVTDKTVSLPSELRVECKLALETLPIESEDRQVFTIRSDSSKSRKFDKLRKYLSEQKSAGVVPLPDQSSTLYLVPPSTRTCLALGINRKHKDCLICLLVDK